MMLKQYIRNPKWWNEPVSDSLQPGGSVNFAPMDLTLGLIWYVVFLFSITMHEAAHGARCRAMGDRTAYNNSLVSIDPIPHIMRSPFGMVFVPIISFVLGGWMIGWASTPFDPFWAKANRRKNALMALAGPAANLLLILIAILLIRGGMIAHIFHAPKTDYIQPGDRVEFGGSGRFSRDSV